jgi:hypothetical protein
MGTTPGGLASTQVLPSPKARCAGLAPAQARAFLYDDGRAVTVESEFGKGSTFVVRLDARMADAASALALAD